MTVRAQIDTATSGWSVGQSLLNRLLNESWGRRKPMSKRRFAEGTDVPVERSARELQAILKRYGVTRQVVAEMDGHFAIEFEYSSRWYRLTVTPPTPEEFLADVPAWHSDGERRRERLAEREEMRRWRVLLLLVKAKLEAIDDGAVAGETELLPYLMLPDGRVMADAAEAEVQEMYTTGRAPSPVRHLLALPAPFNGQVD